MTIILLNEVDLDLEGMGAGKWTSVLTGVRSFTQQLASQLLAHPC